jgi:hypothetical protein
MIHAWPHLPRLAAIHQQQRRLVVRHVGVHRTNHRDLVDALRDVREQLADFDPALAVFLNLNGDGYAAPVLRSVRRFSIGRFLPAYLASEGFGSNVSTCDGPPLQKMWMTCFALAGKCGCFGARGEAKLSFARDVQHAADSTHHAGEAQAAHAHAATAEELPPRQVPNARNWAYDVPSLNRRSKPF